MILVTGAYGFIGSSLIRNLINNRSCSIVAVDDFNREDKKTNLLQDNRILRIERRELWTYLEDKPVLERVIHLGARTDTLETNERVFDELNVGYSQRLFTYCNHHKIPFLYASSAATYGDGSYGFSDNHALIPRLQPLNPYGWSKHEFDIWLLSRSPVHIPWQGLKFFNVYGYPEQHKERMASVVWHAYHQIIGTGKVQLFQSHHPEISHGHQARDFVYVKDVVRAILLFIDGNPPNGIYNLGTGKARTFLALAHAIFSSLGQESRIDFIPTPEKIRDQYQYFTQADMRKFNVEFPSFTFMDLEEGINEYVQDFLLKT